VCAQLVFFCRNHTRRGLMRRWMLSNPSLPI
jgi:hypothetical protein